MSTFFSSIISDGTFSTGDLLISIISALVSGLIIAGIYMVHNDYSKSFVVTLALIPSIVGLIIILVNGNIGTGVAVAGAFSLVRFRSAPGRGEEITSIFLAMAVGLAAGMGYIGIAICFTILISLMILILNITSFGGKKLNEQELKILVPENLDYEGKFNDIFEKYLDHYQIEQVKTAEMGTLYKIEIRVAVKKDVSVKKMIDELRTRNGNLEISIGRPVTNIETL